MGTERVTYGMSLLSFFFMDVSFYILLRYNGISRIVME